MHPPALLTALALALPLAGGVVLFGWRAAAAVATVALAAAVASLIWRPIGARGLGMRFGRALVGGMTLGLLLPATLFDPLGRTSATDPVPLLILAGVLLVSVRWLLGAAGPLHPVAVTYLLLALLFGPALLPGRVLPPSQAARGDLLADAQPAPDIQVTPWYELPADYGSPRLAPVVAERLTAYATDRPPAGVHSVEAMLRDGMPPVEDLLIGGTPTPIGAASGLLVIVGGLFAIYRGLVDFRVPILVITSAYAAFLLLPIPVAGGLPGTAWTPVVRHVGAEPTLIVTWANYLVLSGTLLFTAFFLAPTAAAGRSAWARTAWAVLLGAACAAGQLYVAGLAGPLLGIVAIGAARRLIRR